MKSSCLSHFLRLPFAVPKALLLLCFMLSCTTAFGQDIITKTNNVRIEADILKVDSTTINYKLHANPAGPEYIISTLDVLSIVYANGRKQTFAPAPVQSLKVDSPKRDAAYQGHNFIRYSLSDLLFYKAITVSYERILASGKVGIKVPISLSLKPVKDDYDSFLDYYDYDRGSNIFSAGLALTHYPLGLGRFIYYLGPQIDVAKFRYYTGTYPDYNDTHFVTSAHTSMMYSYKLNNGVIYHLTKKLFAGVDVGVGGRSVNYDKMYSSDNTVHHLYMSRLFFSGHLQAGYRF